MTNEIEKRVLGEANSILVGRHVNSLGDFKLYCDQDQQTMYVQMNNGSTWDTVAFFDVGIKDIGKWDDLRFPVTAINPPGLASDPDVDSDDGTYLFDATSTQLLFGVAQIPHSWKIGTDLYPHIHWAPTTADTGDVVWQLDYKLYGNGDTIPGTWTSDSITVSADGIDVHTVSYFSSIDMSAIEDMSYILQWKISRIGGDEDDTYAADTKLIEFDIHYLVDSLGSQTQTLK